MVDGSACAATLAVLPSWRSGQAGDTAGLLTCWPAAPRRPPAGCTNAASPPPRCRHSCIEHQPAATAGCSMSFTRIPTFSGCGRATQTMACGARAYRPAVCLRACCPSAEWRPQARCSTPASPPARGTHRAVPLLPPSSSLQGQDQARVCCTVHAWPRDRRLGARQLPACAAPAARSRLARRPQPRSYSSMPLPCRLAPNSAGCLAWTAAAWGCLPPARPTAPAPSA